MDGNHLIALTAEIVSAHVSNNKVSVDEVAGIVQRVHDALASLGKEAVEEPVEKVPAVSIRASVKPDYLICLECGKRQKMLKRHLQAEHDLTPEQYRQDYSLPASYPMVAPEYSERRRELAKTFGLGRRDAGIMPEPDSAEAPAAEHPSAEAAGSPEPVAKTAAAKKPAARKRENGETTAEKKPRQRRPRAAKNGDNGA